MNNVFLTSRAICPYYLRGMCRFGNRCWNVHEQPETNVEEPGNYNMPQQQEEDSDSAQGACALSPSKRLEKYSNVEREKIYGPSTSSVEEAISLVKISEEEEKKCGICFEYILKKVNRSDQTFGIFPNCNHCYCFACIRKWRQSKEFEFKVTKACPECRIAQDFVYPSKHWMTTKEEKETFIDNQKKKMKEKDCTYFRKGKGKCPFGNTCMYLHALPNGTVLDVGPPKARRTRPASALESEAEMLQQILFWINDDDIESDDDFDDCILDLDDPCIAMQYYDRGDIRRYIAMNRLMNGSDDDDDDIDMLF